ncbi:dipeptidyl aminopeptidase/acylaminoacyl peptidase [Actinoplanes lutulentus]|uniref:WD40 repeat protein n=1 Tax=Actinoplanes lutulentus TaxID=1287878 RepID=A0A327ZLP7_9ACTN|nr:PD40 domain-containing protein [Actinoplanes lutulentus]MBB2942807.1 dipeptidyl aminopeptidase/acylaminoacyl peptidase [Actinoplanes lutulentus]RAK38387.1 WD40 repeat protein [Actinoplanes lutulentus]
MKKNFGQVAGNVAIAAAASFCCVVCNPSTVQAAAPSSQLPSMVAYVRNGDVYASKGSTEQRLTTGGSHARPRWSPNGKQIAFLKKGQVWTMKADGTGQRRLSTRPAAGPSWSPDGKWIAFSSLSCNGGPGVYSIPADGTKKEKVLFPRDCRTEALPAETEAAKSVAKELKSDNAVAWSPDGVQLAFRGGNCESIYDSCLSVGDVKTGGEKTVAAFGGGGVQNSGFAVVPSWRSDGAKLAFTAYQEGETATESKPVHLVEYDAITGAQRTIGNAMDRELDYVDASRAVVTSQNAGTTWVTVVGLATGLRTPFKSGEQPSVQPVVR